MRTKSAEVLNDADRTERIINWMLFKQDQDARLWGLEKGGWMPGDPLFRRPNARLRDGDQYIREMIQDIPDGEFHTPGVAAPNRFCDECDVRWQQPREADGEVCCFMCGEVGQRRSSIDFGEAYWNLFTQPSMERRQTYDESVIERWRQQTFRHDDFLNMYIEYSAEVTFESLREFWSSSGPYSVSMYPPGRHASPHPDVFTISIPYEAHAPTPAPPEDANCPLIVRGIEELFDEDESLLPPGVVDYFESQPLRLQPMWGNPVNPIAFPDEYQTEPSVPTPGPVMPVHDFEQLEIGRPIGGYQPTVGTWWQRVTRGGRRNGRASGRRRDDFAE